jgi:DNA repair photolyase
MTANKSKYRGRGTDLNPPNRFERLYVDENEDNFEYRDEWENDERKLDTIFYKDDSRTVIAKNDSPDIDFDYSFNPYRGCEHGCIYCYARQTHEYLGFSSGIDFETKIMVKENSASLLRKEFERKSYKPKLIVFSGDTDCYQPIERKLGITRKALEVCLEYRNPVAIITKNSLLLRDLDILYEMSKLKIVSVTLSITSLNKELASKMEPRTATPERRLATIVKLAEKEIPVGVNLAPIIPGLNDEEIPNILKLSAEHGATNAGYIMLRLPFSNKKLFTNWLEQKFPDRKEKILNKIREMRGGKLNESAFGIRFTVKGEQADAIKKLFHLSCSKYGLNKEETELTTAHFKSRSNVQLEMF